MTEKPSNSPSEKLDLILVDYSDWSCCFIDGSKTGIKRGYWTCILLTADNFQRTHNRIDRHLSMSSAPFDVQEVAVSTTIRLQDISSENRPSNSRLLTNKPHQILTPSLLCFWHTSNLHGIPAHVNISSTKIINTVAREAEQNPLFLLAPDDLKMYTQDLFINLS